MARFTQLSPAFCGILRPEKSQVIVFAATLLPDIADALQTALDESLQRISDPTLPDVDFKVGDKIHLKVCTVLETGAIRTDIREWYADTVTCQLKPSKRGVNLSVEQLTGVQAEVQAFIQKEKDSLTKLAIAAAIQTPDKTDAADSASSSKQAKAPLKRKAKGKAPTPASKKKPVAVKKGRKTLTPKVIVIDSDEEEAGDNLSASDDDEADSD